MRLALAALAVLAGLSMARAHGPAEWIQEGHYKNAASELCCGERDCGRLVAGTVEHVEGGFKVNADFQVGEGDKAQIIHFDTFIPDHEATPSPVGETWICSWGGKIRCFFYVFPGT